MRIQIGKTKKGGMVAVDIGLRDTDKGTELSVCGEAWEAPRSRDIYMGGQCVDSLADEIALWTVDREKFDRLVSIWQEWHLNGMRAGCEHQRAAKWRICPGHYTNRKWRFWEEGGIFNIERGLAEITDCAGNFEACIVSPSDVSPFYSGSIRCGLDMLSKPCPECGYKYGTAWLFEPLPQSVLDTLKNDWGVYAPDAVQLAAGRNYDAFGKVSR